MQTFEVRICDVLIIGMGIAGVAIAEKLAREAWRQGRRIRIILVHETDGPGSCASGGLEGWYHRGFLYALNDDKSLIFTFIHSAEDMYNWYTYDPLFRHCIPNCNFLDVNGKGAPEFDFCSHNPEAWFVSRLPYIRQFEVGHARLIPLRPPFSMHVRKPDGFGGYEGSLRNPFNPRARR